MSDEQVHARRWLTLGALCLSLLIIVMDNTILNVAIPSLMKPTSSGGLGATNSQVLWIVDAYTLVFAGLLLTAGSLGDRFGRKRALRIGIVIFGIGSASSALAGSATQLAVSRAFMGIGGALIMPSTLSILTNVFRDPKERAKAIAVWAGFSGLGIALGPVTGGLLLTHFSWSSVFWVNLPIGLTALILGYFFVPESKDPRPQALDLPGSLLSIVGLGAFLFGIIEGQPEGWTSPMVLAAFAFGVAGIVGFVWWERRTSTPMLDMSFFRNPRFTAANTAVTLTFFAMFGSLILMTQYWQVVHGYTPLQSGVRLIPYAMVMMITAPNSARLVERFGTKIVVSGGLLLISVSMLTLSFIHRDSSYLRVILNMSAMAIGMACVMAPATESVMGSLPREKAGVGSAVNDTTRQVGGALGVAIIGSLVASLYSSKAGELAGRFGISGRPLAVAQGSLAGALKVGPADAAFVDAVKDGWVASLASGLRLASVVVLVAAAVAYQFLPAQAPAERVAATPGHFDDLVPVAGQ
jgi:EmrB/QacA subfamily drug resistance transporter